jgi:hypothetical protein
VPNLLWQLMSSHSGIPNRERKDRYLNLLKKHALQIVHLVDTEVLGDHVLSFFFAAKRSS